MELPAKRILSYALSFILVIEPSLSSASAIGSVVADSSATQYSPSIITSDNGVPIVNIVKPSSKGVSHNKYDIFNVTSEGVVLNNSQSISNTVLAGQVKGNQSLSSGAARIILNEVTSAHRSTLDGYIEVAGQSADLILANPNGISCNGCGFINTPRATLATGIPSLVDGDLNSISINVGDIAIDGLNASNIDRLDILSRAIILNGNLHAKELNLIAGRNDITYKDLAVVKKSEDGSALPLFALDAAALGGMYANSIKLVGTEAGVGVNIDAEMATNNGQIYVSANGDVHIDRALSGAGLHLESVAGDIDIDSVAYADGNVTIQASEQVKNSGLLAASGNLSLNASVITNRGEIISGMNSDGGLEFLADIYLDAENGFYNYGTVLSSRDVFLNSNDIADVSGELQAYRDLTFNTRDYAFGTLARYRAAQNWTINARSLLNEMDFSTDTNLSLNLSGYLTNNNNLVAKSGLRVRASSIFNTGVLGTGGDLRLEAARTPEGFEFDAVGIIENENGLIFSAGDMALYGRNISNRYSDILSLGDIIIAANDSSDAAELLYNGSSTIESLGSLDVTAELILNARDPIGEYDNTAHCLNDFEYCSWPVLRGEAYGIDPDEVTVSQAWLLQESNAINSLRSSGLDTSDWRVVKAIEDLAVSFRKSLKPTGIYSGANIDFLAGVVSNQGGTISAANNFTANSSDFINSTSVVTTTYARRVFEQLDEFEYLEEGGGRPFEVIDGDFILLPPGVIATDSSFAGFDEYWDSIGGDPDLLSDYRLYKTYPEGRDYEIHGFVFYPSLVEAGGILEINATNEIRNGVVTTGSITPKPVPVLPTTVTPQDPVSVPSITDQLNLAQGASFNPALELPDLSDFTKVEVVIPSVIPDGGLFDTGDSRTLIATNPSVSQFIDALGSDYLLQLLGLDPEAISKRLGDSFYEGRLVRDAIFNATGSRYLHASLRSDVEQMRYLMDSALRASQSLNLTLGMSLSSAQIAALTHDIVWMEERTVNGERVLVPTLYLASVRPNNMSVAGSLINGGDIRLTSGGDIINRAGITSRNDLSISSRAAFDNSGRLTALGNGVVQADTVLNSGDINVDRDLTVKAQQDIVNEGGSLTSDNMVLSSINGSVKNTQAQGSYVNVRGDLIAEKGAIETRGDLDIRAGVDIENHGSTIDVGGDVNLSAQRDISLIASEHRYGAQNKSVVHEASRFQVAGNGDIKAGRDLVLKGSELSIAGVATVDVARNLQIESVENVETTYESRIIPSVKISREVASGAGRAGVFSGGFDSRPISTKITSFTETINTSQQASEFDVGSDLILNVGGDGNVAASDINVAGAAQAKIDGALSFTSKDNTQTVTRTTKTHYEGNTSRPVTVSMASVGLVSPKAVLPSRSSKASSTSLHSSIDRRSVSSTKTAVITNEKVTSINSSSLNVADDLVIVTQGDFVNEGGSLSSRDGNAVLVSQQGSVVNRGGGQITAGANLTLVAQNDIVNERSVTQTESQKRGHNITTREASEASQLSADENLQLLAERDIIDRGSIINAGGSATLSAGRDIVLETVTEEFHKIRNEKNRTDEVSHLGSHASVAGDVDLAAGRDVQLIAAQVSSAGSVDVDAARDVSIESAADLSYKESYDGSGSSRHHYIDKKVTQQQSSVSAGGQLNISAGRNVELVSSTLEADEDLSLTAANDLTLEAAANEDYQYRYKKKKGSFGRSSTKTSEKSTIANVGTMAKAGGDLLVNAANTDKGIVLTQSRDVTITASKAEAGNDVVVYAGNELTVKSAEDSSVDYSHKEKSGFGGINGSLESKRETAISQVGANVAAENDAVLLSGKNINIISSQINADQDVLLHAGLSSTDGDINILSASNSSTSHHRKEKSSLSLSVGGLPDYEKNIVKDESVTQTNAASVINAGDDVSIRTTRDITLVGSDVSAAETVSLSAGGETRLLAATEYHQEHHEEDNTSWGISTYLDNKGFSTYSEDELKIDSSNVTHRGSTITAGTDVAVESKGNVIIQSGRIESGGDISIKSETGAVALLTTSDTETHSEEGKGSTSVWQYQKGEGASDETVKHTEINAAGDLHISAAQGVIVEYRQGEEGENLKQTLKNLSETNSDLQWLEQLQERDDIDWQSVAEAHEQWDYESEGLTQVAALVIVIVITVVTAGAGSGAAAGTAGASGAGGATLGTGAALANAAGAGLTAGSWSAIATSAAFSSLASTAALSVINNKGDLGEVLDELGSSDSIKGIATAAITAGLGEYVQGSEYFNNLNKYQKVAVQVGGDAVLDNLANGGSFDESLQSAVLLQLADSATQSLNSVFDNRSPATIGDGELWLQSSELIKRSATEALVESLVEGESVTDSFKASLSSNILKHLTRKVGDLEYRDELNIDAGDWEKVLAHAAIGCIKAESTSGNCGAGALGAASAEVISPYLNHMDWSSTTEEELVSLVAQAVAAVAGKTSDDAVLAAIHTDQFNRQLHIIEQQKIEALALQWSESDGSVSYEEAKERLAVIALSNVDGIGRLLIDEVDAEALNILDSNGFIFVDAQGVTRHGFQRDEDYWKSWIYQSEQASWNGNDFYRDNIHNHLSEISEESIKQAMDAEIGAQIEALSQSIEAMEDLDAKEATLAMLEGRLEGTAIAAADLYMLSKLSDDDWKTVYGEGNVASAKEAALYSSILLGVAKAVVGREKRAGPDKTPPAVTPEGKFSKLDDPADTYRNPNSRDQLRADTDHPQQTGTFVTDPNKVPSSTISNRQKYMGGTPGKNTSVGTTVQDRMRSEGTLRGSSDSSEVLGSDGKWYSIKDTDMGHKDGAVDYWNREGRYHGAKSKEVRDFMNDPDNYVLEPKNINRCNGAKCGQTYQPPATESEIRARSALDEL